tara:strand:- start:237 stop:1421 length:1185 start_codon:yes stop_codon:yes gene_type:complete
MNQKAQGGLNAALLVAIIAGVIILYILFLPAGEKDDLLGGGTSLGGKTSGSTNLTVLLSEGPEEISPLEKADDKDMPNVYLVEAVNAKELEKINPFSVRNGWFDKKSKTIQFSIDELEDSDNILLSFTATKRQGNLIILLNGEEIYDFQSNKLNVIVELEKYRLQKINTLEFSVPPVGIKFWTTNEYNLDDIKIVGDITDRSRQESRNVFELTKSEYNNLKKATLKFIPYCSNVRTVGLLDVSVNNRNLYSAVPVCDDQVEIPITSVLSSGENKVIFKTSQGSYSIEQIRLSIDSKDVRSLSYFFELTDEQYADLQKDENEKYLNLSIRFIDDDETKKADVNINNHPISRSIDQTEPIYNKRILKHKLEEDTNYIEIRPKTTLKIVELEVFMWD